MTSEDARAFLEEIFEAAAGLAVLVGDELRCVKANSAYRALTPNPEIDPAGQLLGEIWGVSDPAIATAFRQVLASGTPIVVPDHAIERGGATRWYSYHVRRVVYCGEPALLHVLVETTAFVLARRSAEEALGHALRRAAELDAVIDAIADGFVLYGRDGEVLRVNATAARLFGDAGAVWRKPLRDFPATVTVRTAEGRALSPEEWPAARALAGETVSGAHLRLEVPRPGRSCWVLASAAPIRAPDGRTAGAVLTLSDETAIHDMEEARDDLVRMISHDLRTPLNAVYTQAHLIRRAPTDSAKVSERARSIVRSCERMSAMIHDLVETTLLEAGQLQLAAVPVDLSTTIPELLERLRGGLDVDRVRLTLASDPPRVLADPARLERIVVNLLSNALKYSPPQAPVELGIAPAPAGCLLTVTDRGVGIAPEDQAHVFERFFRARGARRPEGLGLGLYITRLLVEAHQGRIEVESGLGQGSTFRVFLPAA